MSLRLRLLNGWLSRIEKPRLARIGWEEARRRFERQRHLFRRPPGASYRRAEIGGVPVTWAEAGRTRPEILLWLHGGAHLMGSPDTHRAMLARLAALTGLAACLPDMRLAPEHPYPAALEDATAVWDGLLAEGRVPGGIVLGGDSSGGGLMLALLARLLARGEVPALAVAFSPWTDLTAASPSLHENAERDVLLPASRYAETVGYYLAGADPADPGASPLFARFPSCPPVFLQAGRTEILRDDTTRMADRLRDQGAEVDLDLWPDTPHVVAMFQGWLPEADAVLARTARFIRARLPALRQDGS